MKKSYLLVLLAFAMVAFSGCKLENSNIGTDAASRGMLEGWQQGINDMNTLFLNTIFNFNAWYSAPDSLRDEIEDKYLPHLKIRQVGENTWAILRGTNLEMLIETNGTTLASSAHWTVSFYGNAPCYGGYMDESFSGEGLRVEIESVQPYTWNITVEANPAGESSDFIGDFEPYVQLTLGFVDTTLFNGAVPADLNAPFSLTGQGRFKFRNKDYWIDEEQFDENDYTYLDFYVGETLVNDTRFGGFACWSQGSVKLRAFNAAGAERVVRVSFQKNGEDYDVDLECLR